ncbi:MAG TPA: type II secretion system F family protein [Acidobacteriaceae bacterium]|nr:type II secretion system F family protein [Acidobacteriaceae bacterium]
MLLGVIFVTVLLVSFGIVALFTRPTSTEQSVHVRLEEIQATRLADSTRQQEPSTILKEQAPGLFSGIDRALGRFAFSETYSKLATQAGTSWTLTSFLVYSVAGGGTVCIPAYFICPVPILDGILGCGGASAPYLYLKFRRSRRLRSFNSALPDAIDLMSRALRAGHSLSSAIEVLSDQAGEAVATEFNTVARQQNFGLPLRDALLQMADRVPSKDLRFLVTAMLVQKETGGNLTDILDRTTFVIRERLRIEGEVRVRTAQGRLTGWILSLLPVLMLFLLNMIDPDYSRMLLHDPTGQKLLYLGVALIAIGSFFINRIVNIQV